MIKRVVLSLAVSVVLWNTASAQEQPKVLAELFTNTNCGNCRVPEEAFEQFVDANTQYGVVRIVYHNEITNPDDYFYVVSKPDVDAREQMYGLNANPLGIIDGFPLGNNESIWETTVKQAAAQALPVTVAISSTSAGDNKYSIHVALTGTLTKQAKLFVALTEDNIIYNNTLAYGNPTSGHWDDIFRAMLPSSSGSDAFQLSGSKSFDVTADLTDQDWNPSNMHVVAFVQDVTSSAPSSFQVEGFSKQSLTSLGVVRSTRDGLSIYPTERGIRVVAPTATRISLDIRDLLGRSVYTTSARGVTAGQYSFEDVKLPAGAYIATAFADGQRIGSCKVIY